MSVQFGRWNTDGKPVDPDYLEKVKPIITLYGPDDGSSYTKDAVGILYRAFHTTKESRRESQPYVTDLGAIITWDGRLDNRAELIRQLRDRLTISPADEVSIVAAAYQVWGTDCFAKLVGDWALSIWDPKSRSLLLAKDPIGTRHLYYSIDSDQVTWSAILDPLVLLAGKSFALCEEYIAGWFSFFPATHLTPYIGIHSVPPSSSVVIRNGKQTVTKYWDFDPAKTIRYRSDAEYEEHFRVVFAQAVRRRIRSDSPILAELSGGMDSASIVCMADAVIAREAPETPRLDTISYYDDSEPNWNERPFFTKVEEMRGRMGTHIDIGQQEPFKFQFDSNRFAATPSTGAGCQNEVRRQYAACIGSQRNRVVLSGVGGDEVTGGVPTPTPEIEDLLATAELRTLAHQLKVWALNERKPWFHLFFKAARRFFPPTLVGVPKHKHPVPWLNPSFIKRNKEALWGYESALKLFGPLPTFQENVFTLAGLQRQLGCEVPPFDPSYEKRYPYLDRDLLEFMYAIPREQLVRPGQRRSLMRRALAGIVPSEILNRKRKAFAVRGPMVGLGAQWMNLIALTQHMCASQLGIVDSAHFADALRKMHERQEVPLVRVLRTLVVEYWIRNLHASGVLPNTVPSVSSASVLPEEL